MEDTMAAGAQSREDQAQVFSYSQILRSSSILGGAQGVNYLIAMVRTKLVAILLGPEGVGLVGLYTSAITMVGTVAGLGIGSSGVREVAEVHASGDAEGLARTVKVLHRASWVTGLFGLLLAIACAPLLSVWTFGSSARAGMLALLGISLLLTAIQAGQSALLQGMRRIGDLARLSVLSAIASTVLAAVLYAWLGEKGIVPVLITSAALNLAISYWFTRRVRLSEVILSWPETWRRSRRLVGVGLAFMYGAVLTAAVALATRSLIVRQLGLESNGIYQAAWGISGMFAAFILNAMGTDFYPRLTAVASDHKQVNRLVNEQTEIGILLALPGLLATLAFAPWLMTMFYTNKFLTGAELLPWFVLGIFGRVIGWPVGFIQMAKGATGWLLVSHTHSNVVLLLLTLIFLKILGLPGTAVGFAVLYLLHNILTFFIARRLTHFSWSRSAIKLFTVSVALVAIGFALQQNLSTVLSLIGGTILTVIACWVSLYGMAHRLGSGHRIVRFILSIPGLRFVCGL